MKKIFYEPRPLKAYLARINDQKNSRWFLCLFHKWIQKNDYKFHNITKSQIDAFLSEHLDPKLAPITKKSYRGFVQRYTNWCFKKGLCNLKPSEWRSNLTLTKTPEALARFLELTQTITKPSTQANCKQHLLAFHKWLAVYDLTLEKITREHMLQWMHDLFLAGLSESSRTQKLIYVRQYLNFLFEAKYILNSGEDLIRKKDFPKLPDYLPRPLPWHIDLELKKRLKNSQDPYCWGLLLMRNTGLRSAELRSLSFECVIQNPDGKRLLKVPLGKMNTERLVPLDDFTYDLILKIQSQGLNGRKQLLLSKRNKTLGYHQLVQSLKNACAGFQTQNPITTHRLRHTYATELLNAGVSYFGLMRLLGHNSILMTLRYAKITSDTVQAEYEKAMQKIENRYYLDFHKRIDDKPIQPSVTLNDTIRLLDQNIPDLTNDIRKKVNALRKRLKYLQSKLIEFQL